MIEETESAHSAELSPAAPPAIPAPAGHRWVFNRLATPYEQMFDGRPVAFAPFEYKLLAADLAEFLWIHSTISVDVVAKKAVRALAMDGMATYGKPSPLQEKPAELLDRTTEANLAGKAAVDDKKRPIPTKPRVIAVEGGSVRPGFQEA